MSKKRVLAAGVFDVFHAGHLHFLDQAAKLGDELVLLVTSDPVAKSEGKKPRFSASQRAALLKRLKLADRVVIGRSDGDILKTIRQLRPAVIALGYDQAFPKSWQRLLAKANPRGTIVRLARFRDGADH